MRVIATAGHVDHGKSSLVQALSGIDPDRLAEEKARGMTIDLGFAWLSLPGGEQVGIVDVPGHIDFIENMLAGVGSVDAVLFVVAADEGVMPQTREHLSILDLLGVSRGVIALTKVDLIDDPDWLELVQEELGEVFAGTLLAQAPIVPVSSITRQGLPALLSALTRTLAAAPDHPDLGRPRLPIDRVFTISGFGTVVTGTLSGGSLHVGDEVVLAPGDARSRIRGLQTHKTKLTAAQPGSRVAVNLSGIHPDQIQRGQVLTLPGLLRGTLRVDVRLRALADLEYPLPHNMEISFHSAAAESHGRLRLLEADDMLPGEETWAQIELQYPLALTRGDRFIIRRPSPSATVGGGVIVDPAPRRKHRRRQPEVLAALEVLLQGDPADLLETIIHKRGPLTAAEVLAAVDLGPDRAQAALAELMQQGRAQLLDPTDPTGALTTPTSWNALRAQLQDAIRVFHQANPLRLGIPREEAKSRIQPKAGWPARLFNAIVTQAVAENAAVERSGLLALPDFQPQFAPSQKAAVDALLARFRANPFTPPSAKESLEVVSTDVLEALIEQNLLVRLAPDVLFERSAYDQMVDAIRQHVQGHGQITVAECRDLFNTSRKYALALMEHLDQIRVTRREGDARVLR